MKTLIKLTVVGVCLAGLLFASFDNKKNQYDIMMNNIEALADGEGSMGTCIGTGSMQCGIVKAWRVNVGR